MESDTRRTEKTKKREQSRGGDMMEDSYMIHDTYHDVLHFVLNHRKGRKKLNSRYKRRFLARSFSFRHKTHTIQIDV